jgi:molecular chaperone DnaK
MSKVLGIDLGTTNSVVAVFEAGEARIVPDKTGARTTPSIVAFTDDGRRLVGTAARNQQITNPANTIYSIKRFMGRRHRDVAHEEKIVPYPILGKPDEFVQVRAGKRKYLPQEISAMILRSLKESATAELEEEITRAVITVPAYFTDSQRKATKDAGAIAGLTVERIINEPTAAALAYGLHTKEQKQIVVFDFGGGTFDISAMRINSGNFQVLGVHGNTHLGGDDFDQRIIDVVADDFRRKNRIDLRQEPMALQRLKEAAEKAKTELSQRIDTEISLPFIAIDGNGPKHLQYTLTRKLFESLCTDLFDELRKSCQEIRNGTGLWGRDISDLVMVGGSTRIPKVQEIAKEVFEVEQLNRSINPDEVVGLGAAVLGGVLQGDLKDVRLMDVTSHSLGVELRKDKLGMLIPKSTPIPCKATRVYSTPQHNQTSVPIHVLEGEDKCAKDNRTLALFQLRGLPKLPRGVPQIEVTFEMDANGILQVTAKDQATGKSQEVQIRDGVGLEKTEIEKLRKTRDEFEEADVVQQTLVDLNNHAERVLNDVGKWFEFNHKMMPKKTCVQVAVALDRLKRKLKGRDSAAIKASLKKLDKVVLPLRKAG